MMGVSAHKWLGAPQILGSLEASGLPPDVVWMDHFSWHVATVAVLAMVVMFTLAARRREHVALTIIASAMSASFAVIGIGLATFANAALWTTPAPYAWGPVTIIGSVGVLLRGTPYLPTNNR
mgnify:FL=1|tara:strand:- start:55 stop:420 length:366 start_codon:yes stop_codon:yes gene_type:complete